ncbi:MAG: hypothetical protein R2778_02330 [Saprospiraceae bacterium]
MTDIKPIENKYLILSTLQTGLFLIDPVRKEYYPLDYTVGVNGCDIPNSGVSAWIKTVPLDKFATRDT